MDCVYRAVAWQRVDQIRYVVVVVVVVIGGVPMVSPPDCGGGV
jgi:hypothetical protein